MSRELLPQENVFRKRIVLVSKKTATKTVPGLCILLLLAQLRIYLCIQAAGTMFYLHRSFLLTVDKLVSLILHPYVYETLKFTLAKMKSLFSRRSAIILIQYCATKYLYTACNKLQILIIKRRRKSSKFIDILAPSQNTLTLINTTYLSQSLCHALRNADT